MSTSISDTDSRSRAWPGPGLPRRFRDDRRGNFAIMFSLSLIPILGAVGIAVDYARALNVRSFLQAHADGVALSGAKLGPSGDPSAYLGDLRAATVERFGAGWADKIAINDAWPTATDFKVTVQGAIPLTFLAAVPGLPHEVAISVTSVARIAEPRYIYKPPVVTQLDPEAADYNRVSV